jgi:hypothetical protein
MLKSGTVNTMFFVESISTIARERLNLSFSEVAFSVFEKQADWN